MVLRYEGLLELCLKVRKGQKRPADAVAHALMVARIATGEIEDDGYDSPCFKGSVGGMDRAFALSLVDC